MKKTSMVLLFSAGGVLIGLLSKPYSKMICFCLVLGGLITFLGELSLAALNQIGKRCPNCGTKLYVTAAKLREVHHGFFPCPKCGALVRVDHTIKK